MAIPGSVTPSLNIRRSAQSGSKVMTAAWQVVYTESSTVPFSFLGADINLTPMAAPDTIETRIRKIVVSGGSLALVDQKTYTGVQPTGHVIAHIASIMATYGFEIAMRQTAGALATIECEFIDAKRIGS